MLTLVALGEHADSADSLIDASDLPKQGNESWEARVPAVNHD